jgi:ferredoxin--NADP+ reductase
MSLENFHVAIIGAGPAGLYAAQTLAKMGVSAVLLNRDLKPGGLAEYGIYPDKYKMKDGLRAQFEKILALPQVEYLGNVTLGKGGALALDELFGLGFDAVLVTVGAQGTKWLGLPGEDLRGVYHAKDLVYHYNQLPPFSRGVYEIGKNVIIVGVGNVMMDIAHWLVRELQVTSVTALARRGPAEVKFDKKEFQVVGANVDIAALDVEIARCAPFMQVVGQDPAQARAEILTGLAGSLPPISSTRMLFRFLGSPKAMLGDAEQRVRALEVENNELTPSNGDTRARGLGTFQELECDTVIFAIGDAVDAQFGLPIARGEFARHPEPRFPMDNTSYEAYDPETQAPVEGVFLAGWARKASTGLVGVARKDGTNGANAVAKYLETLPAPSGRFDRDALSETLRRRGVTVIERADLALLRQAEQAEAKLRGVQEHKFKSNEEMLRAMCK